MNQTHRSILGIITAISLSSLSFLSHAEEIGSVDTVFKILGPDHKIVVEAFDDPDVEN
ncbi:CreA family protein, partial [Klebsiella variicola]